MKVNFMEIAHPIILPLEKPQTSRILRLSANLDLTAGSMVIRYTDLANRTDEDEPNAKCSIVFADSNRWLAKWSKSSYLIRSRLDDLTKSMLNGSTHRILRGMAYKLFASLVEYEGKFQGMDQVLINTEELEAVALLKLCPTNEAGNFFCSPYWIDTLVHLSGFVMNATDAFDAKVVFISHGWDSFQLAEEIDPTKDYKVYVKMQEVRRKMFAGDVFILEGETQVGLVKGLKFQQIPRSLLDTMLPRSGSVQTSKNAPERCLSAQSDSFEPLRAKPAVTTSEMKASDGHVRHRANRTDLYNFVPFIAEEIGISTDEIPPDAEFSSLGVDSLLSLTILAKLKDRFSIDLPQTLFEDHPTLNELQKFISNSIDTGYSSGSSDSGYDSPPVGQITKIPAISSIPAPSAKSQDSGKIAQLRTIVATEIGVEIEELLNADDLIAFGVDSLMSLTIAGAIQQQLGISASPDIFTTVQSMKDLEMALGLSMPVSSPSGLLSLSQHQLSQATSQTPLSTLLQGNPRTCQQTLFLFPDGSGSASSYSRLPLVSSNLAVYGLNSPSLRAGPNASFKVEDIAQTWVREIKSKQPSGPFVLGGWSSGGYYAFEAAKILMEAGDRVEKLILIDTPPRNVYEPMSQDVLQWLTDHKIIGDSTAPRWLVEHFTLTINAVDQYVPMPLVGIQQPKVYLIWATDGVANSVDGASELDFKEGISHFLLENRTGDGPIGWEQLLPGCTVKISMAPGNHFNMVLPPNVSFSHLHVASLD
jgi:iterative type I PKS product template protein